MGNLLLSPSPLAKAVAPVYDSSVSYMVGDYCTKGGKIYKCIESTTGSFDSTKWTEVLITDELENIEDNNTLTKTITTPEAIQSFTDGAAWPMEMQIAIEPVQTGSGDPSPSNVRHITGWDGANISVARRNLCRKLVGDISSGITGIVNNDGSVTISGKATSNDLFVTVSGNNAKVFLKAGTYLAKLSQSGSVSGCAIRIGDSGGSYIAQGSNTSFTLTKDDYIQVRIRVQNQNGNTLSTTFYPMILQDGDTATEFIPCGDNATYPITFPTSAGTVYDGTITVHADRTGTLTITQGSFLISDQSWTYGASYQRFSTSVPGIKRYDAVRKTPMMASCFVCIDDGRDISDVPNYAVYGGGQGDAVHIKDADHTTASDFVTAFGSQRVVYPLATPLVYTLSAPQVLSLLGQNYIWADCGNINSLSYVRRQDIGFIREDTAGQISAATDPIQEELGDAESSLEIVIDGDTAPKAITSGQYLFVKNHSTLATGAYHATAAIAKDASVTSNNTSPDPDGVANAINANIPEVVDNLTTQDATKALSANQGYALNSKISTFTDVSSEFTKSSVTTSISAIKKLGFVRVKAVVNVPSSGATAFYFPTKYGVVTASIERNAGMSCFWTEASSSYPDKLACNVYPTSNLSSSVTFTVYALLYEP